MLFNSYGFIFVFLPISLAGFFIFSKFGSRRSALIWLIAASLFFYGWWSVQYLPLICGSVCFNFLLSRFGLNSDVQETRRRIFLCLGVAANLALISYFKYANFFLDNVYALIEEENDVARVILPIAISFFTFQQIAFLVDSYRNQAKGPGFLHYCLFITFFPQLIAGPIVHHKEMMPQFLKGSFYHFKYRDLLVGGTIFFIGLFKKTVIADGVAVYANPVFQAASVGAELTFIEGWSGALAYSFQLYFDFSGYSDMAIGLARMFGLYLPVNFNSPYKSANIIEFWRRWHMTLSRFLRDYLYFPLGGNRQGQVRRNMNIVITMLLGGLWHGAGWSFLLWGGLHGLFIVLNHLWRYAMNAIGCDITRSSFYGRFAGRCLTFLVVVIAWVPFRAESLESTENILRAMAGMNGFALPVSYQVMLGGNAEALVGIGVTFKEDVIFQGTGQLAMLFVLFFVVWFAPNTQDMMRRYRPALMQEREPETDGPSALIGRFLIWRASPFHAAITAVVTVSGILALSRISEFLYFQF